jgi:hypothetical protein
MRGFNFNFNINIIVIGFILIVYLKLFKLVTHNQNFNSPQELLQSHNHGCGDRGAALPSLCHREAQPL